MNDYVVKIDGKKINIKLKDDRSAKIGKRKSNYELITANCNSHLLKIDERVYEIYYNSKDDDGYSVTIDGETFELVCRTTLQEKAKQLIEAAQSGASKEIEVRSPMPGMIVKINKKPGDKVKLHESVVLLEAMKMENDIKSPREGVIKEIVGEEGTAIEKNVFLFSVE